MNGAEFHLLVNHFPIIFPIIGIIVLIISMVFKSSPIKRTAYFIFALSSIAALVAVKTGDGAEELIDKIGISKILMDKHKAAAKTFATLCYVLGGISLIGIWLSIKQKNFSKIFSIIILVFAFVLMYFAYKTGNSGGQIMHNEIRSAGVVSQPT